MKLEKADIRSLVDGISGGQLLWRPLPKTWQIQVALRNIATRVTTYRKHLLPFEDIQKVIDRVPYNGALVVPNGEYGDVLITQPIRLLANRRRKVTLKSLVVHAPCVHIDGFNVQSGIVLDSQKGSITNCTFTSS